MLNPTPPKSFRDIRTDDQPDMSMPLTFIRFTFKLGIRKAIQLLKNEEFDNKDDITIGSTYSLFVIGIKIGEERAKHLPIDQG
jgi:hypothetical protein